MSDDRVPINPGVSVLGVLRHLNYQEWFAIAEFVDNAVQSFRANRAALEAVGATTLTVRIDVGDDGTMRIADDAAGIPVGEFPRAFRPAQAPADASGLSEFGMGMKSAACWFAPKWSVRTKALGEAVERTVEFDVAAIVAGSVENLPVHRQDAPLNAHYTVVELFAVTRIPRTRTLGKVKEHLSDIYRQFLREGWLRLEVKGEQLVADAPDVLRQSPEWDKDAEPVLWRKEVDFDFGDGKSARGFAALFAVGNTRRAGFALFRRGRLIQGSGDEGFKPAAIFGSGNSFRKQRLFGELNLEGFEVSHTKDGFQWDEEEEEAFLDLLKERLAEEPVPLLRQAEEFRARKRRDELEKVAAKAARETAVDARKGMVAAAMPSGDDGAARLEEEEPSTVLPLADETFRVRVGTMDYEVHVQPTTHDADRDWLRIIESDMEDGTRKLIIRVSAHHPFHVRFVDDDERSFQAVLRMAAAVAIAQDLATKSHPDAGPGARRTVSNLNKTLRGMSE